MWILGLKGLKQECVNLPWSPEKIKRGTQMPVHTRGPNKSYKIIMHLLEIYHHVIGSLQFLEGMPLKLKCSPF